MAWDACLRDTGQFKNIYISTLQKRLLIRCGSRTPDNPRWTWDSVCNCTGPGSGVGKGFLTKAQIKDMDATYRWETYDRTDKFGTTFNTLTDPRSKDFMALKRNIEARVSFSGNPNTPV